MRSFKPISVSDPSELLAELLEVANPGPVAGSGLMSDGVPDKITNWHTKTLHSMFGLENWEDTQLFGILHALDFAELRGCFLAGGAIVRHLMKTDVAKGDIDLYFTKKEFADEAIKKYKDVGYKIEKGKFSYFFELPMGMKKIKVQIIYKNTGSIQEVLSKFDFEHVRLAFTNGKFSSTMGATTAIAQKELHLRYVSQPDYSLLRALKYKKLGFNADKAIQTLAVMINKEAHDVNAAEWESIHPIVEY